MEKFVKDILENRKLNAEKKAQDTLKRALYDKSFKSIYSKYKSLEIEKAKNEVYNKPFDNKKLEDALNSLKKRLKELGLKYEDLSPSYTCKKCEDTGIYNNKECDCVKEIKSNELLKLSGLNFKPHTFAESNFSIFDNPEILKKFYSAMKSWCNTPTTIKNIIISGQSGVGKSFLLECMLSELIEQKKYVLYTTAFTLSQNLLKYHTTFDANKESILAPYLDCDVLIIDDLGTEPIFKNVTEEYLYLILNQRTFEQKPVIISTNLSLENIKNRYGERIFSRLINKNLCKLFQIENRDLRLKKNN